MKRQIVGFIRNCNGMKDRATGIEVGKVLVIAYPNKYDETCVKIFSTLTGKPLVDIQFASDKKGIEDAIQVAQWLDETYGYYLEIPTAKGFEDANVIDLCQWTITNGIQIRIAFEILQRLHTQVDHMTAKHVTRAYELAAPEVSKWLGYLRPR